MVIEFDPVASLGADATPVADKGAIAEQAWFDGNDIETRHVAARIDAGQKNDIHVQGIASTRRVRPTTNLNRPGRIDSFL